MSKMHKRSSTRKYKKSAYLKKRNYRRKTDGGKVQLIRNSLVPDRTLIRLSYKDDINLSATGPITYATSCFRANSIYDPDVAIVNGHQPLGYDQWQVFYNKYRVYKAMVKVTFINNTSSGVRCLVLPYNGSVISTIDDSTFEQPHAATKVLGGVNGMNKCVIKKMIDVPRILGQSHLQYQSNEDTSAQFNYNPVEQVNCTIAVNTINSSSAATVQATVEIIYYCELFDRKTQTISYPSGKNPDEGRNPAYNGFEVPTP